MRFRNHELIGPARFRNVSGLLLVFVAISLLVHGSTLLLSTENDIKLPAKQLGATVISTVLSPANNKPAPTSSGRTPAATTSNKKVSKSSESSAEVFPVLKTPAATSVHKNSNLAAHKTPAPEPQPRNITQQQKRSVTPEKATETNPSPAESLANKKEKQRNYLLGELQNRLSKYLTYPLRARRRGWQGDVIVAFHINENGQLNNLRLAHSSGHSLLDRSALSAIRKLHNIAMPDHLGPLQAMDLQLPVHYRLQES